MVFAGLESLRQYGTGETIVVNGRGGAVASREGDGGREGRVERSRGRAAGGANGRRALRGYEGRTETPPQNSQRVLLAKPRTAAVSHRGRWGAVGQGGASREGDGRRGRGRPSRTDCAHGLGTMRRDGDIAPYRQATRAVRT